MGLKNIEKAQVLRLGDEVEYQQGQKVAHRNVARGALLETSLTGFFGCCITPILLFSSYCYLASGMATVFHFAYPVIVVLGGMGSMTGSVLAAVAMYLLNYEIKNGAWVSALPGFVQTLFQFPMLIYALVLLVIIIFRPRGILGTYEFSLDRLLFDGRLAEKRKAKAEKGGADA